VQEPYVQRWVSTVRRGIVLWTGWEAQGPRMKRYMRENPMRSLAQYRRENLTLRIGADMAWAAFDQYAIGARGPEVDLSATNHEVRVLERQPDGWKIAAIYTFQRSLDHVSAALVRVDENASVVWMNDAAKAALRAGRGLSVRGGRLRASNRDADARLQAAVRWASESEGGTWPRHGTLAVVLEARRGEPAQIAWVIARGGETFVGLASDALVEERLGAAAAVYGISPAQMRLARLIVAGHDLVSAGRELGISFSTARTQLHRMFEKTGVRSQVALVRALLSTASPLG
jgi:DNA-binding CsgD family transcriptional regulator